MSRGFISVREIQFIEASWLKSSGGPGASPTPPESILGSLMSAVLFDPDVDICSVHHGVAVEVGIGGF